MTHQLEKSDTRTRILWDPAKQTFHAESNDPQITPVLRRLADRHGVILSDEGDTLRGTFPKAADLGNWDAEAAQRIEFGVAFNKPGETLPAVLAAPIRVEPVIAMPAHIREPAGVQVVSDVVSIQPERWSRDNA